MAGCPESVKTEAEMKWLLSIVFLIVSIFVLLFFVPKSEKQEINNWALRRGEVCFSIEEEPFDRNFLIYVRGKSAKVFWVKTDKGNYGFWFTFLHTDVYQEDPNDHNHYIRLQ